MTASLELSRTLLNKCQQNHTTFLSTVSRVFRASTHTMKTKQAILCLNWQRTEGWTTWNHNALCLRLLGFNSAFTGYWWWRHKNKTLVLIYFAIPE